MFISIITVVYNGGATIGRTIESILRQAFDDYEYIIQDGRSTDSTLAVAHSFEERFGGRLRIYSEPDEGIYDAMNKAIEKAKGEYIWLVNADDWIVDGALQQVHSIALKLEKPRVICGGVNTIDPVTLHKVRQVYSGEVAYSRMHRTFKMGVCHPATVIPRCCYSIYGLYDTRFRIAADLDYVLRLKKAGACVCFPQVVLSNFVVGGVSSQFSVRVNMKDYHLLFKKHIKCRCLRILYNTIFFIRSLLLSALAGNVEKIVKYKECILKK